MKYAVLFSVSGNKLENFEAKLRLLAIKEDVEIIYRIASLNPIRLKVQSDNINQETIEKYVKTQEEIV